MRRSSSSRARKPSSYNPIIVKEVFSEHDATGNRPLVCRYVSHVTTSFIDQPIVIRNSIGAVVLFAEQFLHLQKIAVDVIVCIQENNELASRLIDSEVSSSCKAHVLFQVEYTDFALIVSEDLGGAVSATVVDHGYLKLVLDQALF